jgi:hypothetical protein
VLVGGGCYCKDGTTESRPAEGSNSWHCRCESLGGFYDSNRAYALCADGGSAVCGDGLLDAGEQCDSTQVAACPDGRCGEGCVCACGNGRLDPGEVCEGAGPLAAACPGSLCGADCQCTCGNGSVDPGEQCEGASAAGCPTGICLSNCSCQCGNGHCDDLFGGGGIETPANCRQDCIPPYSRCGSSADCAGLAYCGAGGYCTTSCAGGSACNLDPGYDELCSSPLPGIDGTCLARCSLHPTFGIYLCPNDLVCESINGGNCIAP